MTISTYTFENFYGNNKNEMARFVGLDLANGSRKRLHYNPITLFGHSGCGKTHLSNAIINKALELGVCSQASYLPLAHYSKLPFHEAKQIMHRSYHQSIALVFDDIDALIGKIKLQELVYNLVVNVHDKNKRIPIVFTSSIHPSDISGIQYRLASFFTAGIATSM